MSDFIVIGAGINGLLLTRELSKSGADVALIDRSETGRESSWAGGGIVSPLYPWRYPPPITALASWAQDFYPDLVAALFEETGIDAQYNQCGLLMLSTDLKAKENAEALRWAWENGRRMQSLDKKDIYQAEPSLAPGFEGGLWMQDVANVRNPRLCQALTASLRKQTNVTLLERCQVTAFNQGRRLGNEIGETERGEVGGLEVGGLEVGGLKVGRLEVESVDIIPSGHTSSRKLRASTIVVCAGAWSAQLLSMLGVRIEVEPVKGQMLLYKFDSPPIESILLTEGRYLIPRLDGHMLAGSTLEHEGFDKSATAQARNSLHECACTLLPALESMSPVKQWAGLRPGAPAGLPYIGRVTQFTNLYVNAGQFRNGLVLAPASARLLADMLLDRDPIVDPTPYDPRRRVTESGGVAN